MTATSIKENLIAQIDKLTYDLQLRVLDYVKMGNEGQHPFRKYLCCLHGKSEG